VDSSASWNFSEFYLIFNDFLVTGGVKTPSRLHQNNYLYITSNQISLAKMFFVFKPRSSNMINYLALSLELIEVVCGVDADLV